MTEKNKSLNKHAWPTIELIFNTGELAPGQLVGILPQLQIECKTCQTYTILTGLQGPVLAS